MFLLPVVSNFNEESTYSVLQSDYKWEASYHDVISFPTVWEVSIASSLELRTRDEDPFLVGAVQDLIANLQAKVRASFVLIYYFIFQFFSSTPVSSAQKLLSVRPEKKKQNS